MADASLSGEPTAVRSSMRLQPGTPRLKYRRAGQTGECGAAFSKCEVKWVSMEVDG